MTMKIKVVDCLEWKAPDQPGELLRFVAAFADEGVDLDILYNCGSGGSIGAAAKKPAKLAAALKELGVKAAPCKCLYLTGKDKTGAMVKAMRKLAAAKINVEYCTVLAAKGKFGAVLWVADSALPKAAKLLKA